MIELKKVSSQYVVYNAAGEPQRYATTWQELDTYARELARANRDLYRRVEPVTPHDTNTIQPTSRLRVSGAGDLAVTFTGDTNNTAVVLAAYAANTIGTQLSCNRVRSTATVATGIEALYEQQF
jgi:hypothetical protein